jgi:hypothetical protein
MLAVRVLAALAALLLVGSSLGQAAHLAVVQHAICAEHGDLLHAADGHAAPTAHAEHDDENGSMPEEGGDHEHCQVLARNQAEQALPAVPAVSGLLPVAGPALLELATVVEARPARVPLSVAPKTSPPRYAAFG